MRVTSTPVGGFGRRDSLCNRESAGGGQSSLVVTVAEPYRVICPQFLIHPSCPLILLAGNGRGIHCIISVAIEYWACSGEEIRGPPNHKRIDQPGRNLVAGERIADILPRVGWIGTGGKRVINLCR